MFHGLMQRERELLPYFYQEGEARFAQWEIFYQYDEAQPGLCVRGENGRCTVRLGKRELFGRSLLLLEQGLAGGGGFLLEESPAYALGALVDCSRGAVPNFPTFKKLVITLSKMGYTALQLYMEDTYELPDYPYFGYRRGRYSAQELRGMDAFAARFGIELIPAVQTLAHLGRALAWPAHRGMQDVGDILLIGEEETYALIDKMFATLSACFGSRRINIGMDEAHLVGLGNYLKRHGYRDRLQLLLEHLGRVLALARGYGLKPMLWGDMFFRLSTGGSYTAEGCQVDGRIRESLPADVPLIYWDYESQEKGVYDRMLEKHREITGNLIFAGGAWKWAGFGPNNHLSLQLAEVAHASCVEHGVGEVLVTAWGDDGAECPLFACLPALQGWAELCYSGQARPDALRGRFAACCGGEWDQFMLLDEMAFTPGNPSPGRCAVNAPKYLLYQDVLCGLFDAQVEPEGYAAHFSACCEYLSYAVGACEARWRYLFATQLALCEVLALKCRVGLDIRRAYAQKDRAALEELRKKRLPRLKALLGAFAKAYHQQWLTENKAAGLEVFDLRIGGLERRVGTAMERIGSYLGGQAATLEELEAPLLPYDGAAGGEGALDIPAPPWHRIATAAYLGSL